MQQLFQESNMHQMMNRRRWLVLASVVCLTWSSGCGGSGDDINRQAISGTAEFEGKPLDKASISFEPAGEGATIFGGATITEGEFTIPAERGLPPGKYRVRISSASETGETVEAPGESSQLAVERIPAEWNANSEQYIQVEDGGDNKFDFKIP